MHGYAIETSRLIHRQLLADGATLVWDYDGQCYNLLPRPWGEESHAQVILDKMQCKGANIGTVGVKKGPVAALWEKVHGVR